MKTTAPSSRERQKNPKRDLQLTLFGPTDHPLLEEIRSIDLNSLTRLDAMQLIDRWKATLREDKTEH